MQPIPETDLSVVPVEGGWSLLSSLDDTPLMFLSGAKAEEKAKALAERIASAGHDARVLIHDRTRALIGTWRYFAVEDATAELPVADLED